MKLKLWEKNFILTFCIFFVLLNIIMGILYTADFNMEYTAEVNDYTREAEELFYRVSSSDENPPDYISDNAFVKIYKDGNLLLDTTAPKMPALYMNGFIRIDKTPYYYFNSGIKKECADCDMELVYIRDMTDFFKRQNLKRAVNILLDILLSAVVGYVLYLSMKKIYAPVGNIAHELRTPLTGISGYAQYLMNGSLSEEDRLFAQQQIINEAGYMNDIIERLLAMESLSLHSADRENIDINRLAGEIKNRYPGIIIETGADCIRGDEALVKSLIFNLIDNAVRETPDVKVIFKTGSIRIINEAVCLTQAEVQGMNKGILPQREKIKGNGYGIRICREIVRFHKWELKYSLDDGILTAEILLL